MSAMNHEFNPAEQVTFGAIQDCLLSACPR